MSGAILLLAVAMWPLDEPTALGVTAVTLPASLLPDVDLYLPSVSHQGVIHTYSVMFVTGVAVGFLYGGIYHAVTDSGDEDPESRQGTPLTAFLLATGAALLGTFTPSRWT